ncbi:hypothetical protein [Polluticoccus soli]|uniref:hypothetical protein n=1 Tax=Polluticoccus soli TaxID=3034150 RepID=UPI0023E2068D|nr:hypothetical protein [Flavipsychrobacter sp. JY13-12]
MTQPRSVIYNVVLFVLCAASFYVNYKACYPGFMSYDSLIQYGEVVSNEYTTWHPPVMAWVWHQLYRFWPGPQAMLALQLSFLWGSCYLFAISFRNFLWGILLVAFFAWAPFIHNFAGWLVKDSQMALAWLLACAIMFKGATSSDRKIGWVAATIAALLIVYGTWLRYNAVVALPPLCILWALLAFRGRTRGVKIAAAVGLLLVTVFGQGFFNNVLLHARKDNTDFQIYFHDLAGVYVRTGKDFFPPLVSKNPKFDTAFIKSHYSAINVTKVLWNDEGKVVVDPNAEVRDALRKSWLRMVVKDPVDYLALRWDIYLHFLGLRKGEPSQYFFVWIVNNDYGFALKESFLLNKYVDRLWNKENAIYFQVWFWILLNALLFPLVLLIRNRLMRLVFLCFAACGFLYTAPQFMLANTVRDFRYIYWACFACIISLLVLIADRWLMRSQKLR